MTISQSDALREIIAETIDESVKEIRATAGAAVLISVVKNLVSLGHIEAAARIASGLWADEERLPATRALCNDAVTRFHQLVRASSGEAPS